MSRFQSTTEHFVVRLQGLSHDQRTNLWSVTCRHCGKTHTPKTTMLAWQTIECPGKKCETSEVINYNDLIDDSEKSSTPSH